MLASGSEGVTVVAAWRWSSLIGQRAGQLSLSRAKLLIQHLYVVEDFSRVADDQIALGCKALKSVTSFDYGRPEPVLHLVDTH